MNLNKRTQTRSRLRTWFKAVHQIARCAPILAFVSIFVSGFGGVFGLKMQQKPLLRGMSEALWSAPCLGLWLLWLSVFYLGTVGEPIRVFGRVPQSRFGKRAGEVFVALLIGSFLFFAAALGWILDANTRYDHSPARTRILSVQSRRTYHNKQDFFLLRGRDLISGEIFGVDVAQPFYQSIKLGEKFSLATHRGALGWEWIEVVEPAPNLKSGKFSS